MRSILLRREVEYGPLFSHSLAFLSPGPAKLATLGRGRMNVMSEAEAPDDEGKNFYGYRATYCPITFQRSRNWDTHA